MNDATAIAQRLADMDRVHSIDRDIEEVDLEASIKTVLQAVNLPTIITVRPLNEGGFYTGEESDRLALLRTGIEPRLPHLGSKTRLYRQCRASPNERHRIGF